MPNVLTWQDPGQKLNCNKVLSEGGLKGSKLITAPARTGKGIYSQRHPNLVLYHQR